MHLGSSPKRTRWLLALALAAAGLALAACGQGPQSILEPAGPVARMQLSLIDLSFWIMVPIFFVVAGVLVYSLIRFRDRGDEADMPEQVEGNHRLEILWTVVPIVLLVLLAVPTARDAFAVAAPPPGSNALQVTVVGHQWWWEFDYPKLGIVTADELHIPVNQPVELSLKSADVIHSFWVPRLAGKTDAIPGRTNTLGLQASQTGNFSGQCAQYCGLSHALMRFRVIAESPSAYQAWVQKMQHPSNVKPTSGAAAAGFKDFASIGCSGCHTIDGTGYQGTVGPNLTNLGLRTTVVASTMKNTNANLAKWLSNPPAIMPGTIMPNFHLSQQQIQDLSAYLESMK